MAENNNPIYASQLYIDDGAIEKAIKQWTDFYNITVKSQKDLIAAAKEIQKTLKDVNAIQKDGQEEITKAAKRVEQIEREHQKTLKQKYDTETKLEILLRQKLKTDEERQKQIKKEIDDYKKLSIEYNEAARAAQNLGAKYGVNNKLTIEAAKKATELGDKLKNIDALVGKHTRSVGNYEKGWNGLQHSMNQLSREMPAFAMNVNTGFMAISNNLPMLFDEINKIKTANKQMAEQGKPTTSVLKQIGSAVFSWGSALSVGVTLLTIFGGKIIDWVGSLFSADDALKEVNESQKQYNKLILEGVEALNKRRQAISEQETSLLVASGVMDKYNAKIKKINEDEINAIEDVIAEYKKKGQEIIDNTDIEKREKIRQLKLLKENRKKEIDILKEDFKIQRELAKKEDEQDKKEKAEKAKKEREAKRKEAEALRKDQLDLLKRLSKEELEIYFKSEEARIKATTEGIDTLIQLEQLANTKRLVDLNNNLDEVYNNEKANKEIRNKAVSNYNKEYELTEKQSQDNILTILKKATFEQLEEYKKRLQVTGADTTQVDALIMQKELELSETYQYNKKLLDAQQKHEKEIFNLTKHSNAEKQKLDLKFRIEQLETQLRYDDKITDEQKDTIQEQINNLTKAYNQIKNDSIFDKLSNAFWGWLGVGKENRQEIIQAASMAIGTTINYIVQALQLQIQAIDDVLQKELEAKDKEIEIYEERKAAAYDWLQNEIQARNMGLANNVKAASIEYENQKRLAEKADKDRKRLEDKAIKDKAAYQKQIAKIESLEQTSSMISASAGVLAGFSKLPQPYGIIAGVIAVGAMWASYLSFRAKAKELGKEQYAEGTYEELRGGSHASGNDISLGVKSNGKERRAEGGEALAIIKKRSTQKYRGILPEIIDSLNKGVFENKFIRAFDTDGMINNIVINQQMPELKSISNDVAYLRKNNEIKRYVDNKGNYIEVKGNYKRIYKNGSIN